VISSIKLLKTNRQITNLGNFWTCSYRRKEVKYKAIKLRRAFMIKLLFVSSFLFLFAVAGHAQDQPKKFCGKVERLTASNFYFFTQTTGYKISKNDTALVNMAVASIFGNFELCCESTEGKECKKPIVVELNSSL